MVLLVSGVQQSDSVFYIYIYIYRFICIFSFRFFSHLDYYKILSIILCYTVGLCWLSIFYLVGCVFGEENGNPLQCSCLENPMDRGAWWGYSPWVAKSQTQLNDSHTHTHTNTHTRCILQWVIFINKSTFESEEVFSMPRYDHTCAAQNLHLPFLRPAQQALSIALFSILGSAVKVSAS